MTQSDFQTVDLEGLATLIENREFAHEQINKMKQQLLEACSEQGFFYIKNHGISQTEIDKIFSFAKRFFAEPEEIKSQYVDTSNIGYSKIGNEKLHGDHHDYKEIFNFKNDFMTSQKIPKIYDENSKFVDMFLRKTFEVNLVLLTCIALSLGLKPDYFAQAHHYDAPSGSIHRILHYPPVESHMTNENTIRAGSHSDYGTLTLLFHETTSGTSPISTGLEVRMKEKDSNGDYVWKDVPSKSGCIIVNVADLLSFWTEGRLRSAIHKVVIPDVENSRKARYAMTHFIQPDHKFPINAITSHIPAPFPAKEISPGVFKATFGESEFFYGEPGEVYLDRRVNNTFY